MLEKVAHWNDLSDGLRKKLKEKLDSLGSKAVFKFNISNENPDPQKYNGEIIWPSIYTLTPKTFDIIDEYEDRPGVSKLKKIGIVETVNEKGIPETFGKIQITEVQKGERTFDMTDPENHDFVAFALMHPKISGSMFPKKDSHIVFKLVDVGKDAEERRKLRELKSQARDLARAMDDDEIKEFIAAMGWDELEEIDVLRDKVETEAEENPKMFSDLLKSKDLTYRATVSRALLRQIVYMDPITGTFSWADNGVEIVVLGPNPGAVDGTKKPKADSQRFAEYLMNGGKNTEAIYRKIEGLLK